MIAKLISPKNATILEGKMYQRLEDKHSFSLILPIWGKRDNEIPPRKNQWWQYDIATRVVNVGCFSDVSSRGKFLSFEKIVNGEYSRVWADGGTSFKRRWTVKFKFDAIRCKKKKVARKISLYEALFHLVTMMREEKFIGGRETKGREYNQSACNFFFVYKETRTMVDESLILSKRKKKKTLEFNELLSRRTSIRQISNGLDFPRSGTPFIEVKF